MTYSPTCSIDGLLIIPASIDRVERPSLLHKAPELLSPCSFAQIFSFFLAVCSLGMYVLYFVLSVPLFLFLSFSSHYSRYSHRIDLSEQEKGSLSIVMEQVRRSA
jgi:hypothetical protein